MIKFKLHVEMFGVEVHYILGASREELRAWSQKKFGVVNPTLGHGLAGLHVIGGCECGCGDTVRFIWSLFPPNTPQGFDTLMHETFHLVTGICQDVGIPISHKSDLGNADETAAYLYSCLMMKAMKNIGIKVAKIR